jgi:hypothetical protein
MSIMIWGFMATGTSVAYAEPTFLKHANAVGFQSIGSFVTSEMYRHVHLIQFMLEYCSLCFND